LQKKDCTLMKLMRSIGLMAVAFGLLGLSAVDAAAQAPTVTWQQSGASLRLEWTAVAGATQYDLMVSGAVNGAVTIPTNFLVVNAPAGTYVVQVRGRNGGTVGPLSNPVTITMGGGGAAPGGCLPLTAPPATASVSGRRDRLPRPGGSRSGRHRVPGGCAGQPGIVWLRGSGAGHLLRTRDCRQRLRHIPLVA
jgi:hypothetical protein